MKYWNKTLSVSLVFVFTLVIVAFCSSNERVYAQLVGHHDQGGSHSGPETVKCPHCGMGIEGKEACL